MKKLSLISGLLYNVMLIYSQSTNVTNCWNYLRFGEIEKAKKAIDPACTHPSTMNKAKTWFYKGATYHVISDSCMYKKSANFCNLAPDATDITFESYMKAWLLNFKDTALQNLNLDDTADAVTFGNAISDKNTKYLDMEIQGQILMALQGSIILPQTTPMILSSLDRSFLNKGITLFYEKQNYKDALEAFETSLFLTGFVALSGRVDTSVIHRAAFLAGLSAENEHQLDKAILYYDMLTKLNYGKDIEEKAQAFVFLAKAYLSKGDTTQYLKVIDKGREKYPDASCILIEQINYYLTTDKIEEAKEKLILATQKEPNNKLLYYNLGVIYDKLKQYDKAEESYKKAIEIDETYFDAYYNLGALYYNRAAEIIEWANANIPINDVEAYNKEKAKADEKFNLSLPYLEKAYQLKPDDIDTITILKGLYRRLGNYEKEQEMKKILDELKQKH